MSNLISVNLDKIARYMLELYKQAENAKKPQVIRNRIIDCQEILAVLGIRVEGIKDAGGNIYEVRAYQVAKCSIYDLKQED